MDILKNFSGYSTVIQYLSSQNGKIRKIVEIAALNVTKAAKESVRKIEKNRELISDVADHLDNEFVSELEFSQADEIKEINKLEKEFYQFYNKAVWSAEFNDFNQELVNKSNELELLAKDLRDKEANIEETIKIRVADAEEKMREQGTTSRHLFESAMVKAEKIIDQNKVTRFAYSTISRFQEEFLNIQGNSDVEFITRLFQDTIEPFQSTKVITDKDGNKVKIVTNTFSEDCYQDLFFFFYKYYNELVDIYQKEKELPSTADELARIFQKKKSETKDIVQNIHNKREAKQRVDQMKS